ncbi:MAG TPA: CDP-glucose 4,6-dehydratase [Longimicrobium sp.]|nr:CDP-glucose 4,6-dehydratase [Longimicrobium sp.]
MDHRARAVEGVVMAPEFWRGRRVLVTGHTGFKGSWLSLWLQRMGAQVTGYALAPDTTPSLFELARVEEGMDSVTGDVRDLDALAAAFAHARPEVVFHLAAQSLVRASYQDPVGTYATNVMGTVNVLEAARRAGGVRAVVVVTSDKCYENREWVWGYRENEAMGGHDPYSSSKGCAELVTAAYRSSFFGADIGTSVGSVRAGNVIGGGDWAPDRLVPDAMRAFGAGEPLVVRNPRSIRPWQHVLEPLAGYLLLGERLCADPQAAEGWNFGSEHDDSRPVGWVADRLAGLWGDGARWEQDPGTHPHEARSLRLDSAKARDRLGWAPRLPIGAALEWTVEWYRAAAGGADARALTEAQIQRYMEAA